MPTNLTDYRHIFLNDVPMMDVRAPVEFGQGAFPGVTNLPLMDDGERQQVGTCYKQQGQEAAIALGHQLVSGATKRQRIEAWAQFARAHPQGVLYCFRGGLRSQIVQQWLLNEAGIDYPRVVGGYKAMRGFLIGTTQAAAAECGFVVLSGLTGTGKTEVIAQLANGLDLEGHANHRGSRFGQRVSGQPTQIDFENRLAIDVLKRRARGHETFVLEDEGRHVGSCSVPLELRQRLERPGVEPVVEDDGRREGHTRADPRGRPAREVRERDALVRRVVEVGRRPVVEHDGPRRTVRDRGGGLRASRASGRRRLDERVRARRQQERTDG